MLHRERSHRELGKRFRLECVSKSERIPRFGVASEGRKNADRLLPDAANREREHSCRCRIEPLDVVDREEQRTVFRELAEGSDERARESEPVRTPCRARLHPESGCERTSLRICQLLGELGEDGVEQVGNGSQRDRHLSLRAARDEHAYACVLSGGDALAPEDRLADAGLAANEECAGSFPELGDEVDQTRLFPAPPDDSEARRYRHARTVGLSLMRLRPADSTVEVRRRRPYCRDSRLRSLLPP